MAFYIDSQYYTMYDENLLYSIQLLLYEQACYQLICTYWVGVSKKNDGAWVGSMPVTRSSKNGRNYSQWYTERNKSTTSSSSGTTNSALEILLTDGAKGLCDIFSVPLLKKQRKKLEKNTCLRVCICL